MEESIYEKSGLLWLSHEVLHIVYWLKPYNGRQILENNNDRDKKLKLIAKFHWTIALVNSEKKFCKGERSYNITLYLNNIIIIGLFKLLFIKYNW